MASLTITPVDFINQGTINAGETLTVGNPSGTWSNQLGTIANAATLILDGAVTTGNLGSITGASNVIEAGLLDNSGATLPLGGGTELVTVTLASGGVVSGGTIADAGGGFAFNGGTLDDVTYQGPLELINPGDNATIVDGLAVTATDGTLPGTIDLTGDGGTLDVRSTPTLAAVTAQHRQRHGRRPAGRRRRHFHHRLGRCHSQWRRHGSSARSSPAVARRWSLDGTLSAISFGGTFTLRRRRRHVQQLTVPSSSGAATRSTWTLTSHPAQARSRSVQRSW